MCGARLNHRAGGRGGGGVKWWSFCSDLNNNFIFQIREPMAELSCKLDSTRVLLQLMGLTRFSSFPSSYFLLLLSFSSFSFSYSSVSSSSSFSPTPSRCHNSSSFTVFCSVNLNYSNLISRVTSADTVPPSSLASPSSRWLLFTSFLFHFDSIFPTWRFLLASSLVITPTNHPQAHINECERRPKFDWMCKFCGRDFISKNSMTVRVLQWPIFLETTQGKIHRMILLIGDLIRLCRGSLNLKSTRNRNFDSLHCLWQIVQNYKFEKL